MILNFKKKTVENSGKRADKVIFVVLFNDPDFIWQKYEGIAYGSGQNYIYFREHKIKTSLFMCLTPEELVELFNGVNPNVIFGRKL